MNKWGCGKTKSVKQDIIVQCPAPVTKVNIAAVYANMMPMNFAPQGFAVQELSDNYIYNYNDVPVADVVTPN